MELQCRSDVDFRERVSRNRRLWLEKLAGMLEECMADSFADYKEMLLEDAQQRLKILQAEIVQKLDEPASCEELFQQVRSLETAGFVNRKAEVFFQTLREREKMCTEAVAGLLLGRDAGYEECAKSKNGREGFRTELLPEPDPLLWKEREAIKEKKSCLNEEIERLMRAKEEAETSFRELVRRNAETRAQMEKEKPEIRYTARKVRREGFLGFVAGLFGIMRTETVADDSELCRWKERAEALQREYDLSVREGSDRIEELKGNWHKKEEEYDRLDTEQRKLEKTLSDQMKNAVLGELEAFLYGESGLFDQAVAEAEANFKQNAERIRAAVWEEYQGR